MLRHSLGGEVLLALLTKEGSKKGNKEDRQTNRALIQVLLENSQVLLESDVILLGGKYSTFLMEILMNITFFWGKALVNKMWPFTLR